jgi:hypothetical protein
MMSHVIDRVWAVYVYGGITMKVGVQRRVLTHLFFLIGVGVSSKRGLVLCWEWVTNKQAWYFFTCSQSRIGE